MSGIWSASCRQPRKYCSLLWNITSRKCRARHFRFPSGEVEVFYSGHAGVRLLAQLDVLAQNPRFQQRGLSHLVENIFLLTLS